MLAALLAFLALIVAAQGARAAGIDDSANLFTPSTLQAAAGQIQTIQQQSGIAVDVVTVPTLNGQDIQAATNAYLQRQSASSIVIYVVRDQRQVAVGAQAGAREKISDREQNGIRDAVLTRFSSGDFDRGLLDGLSQIQLAAVSGPSGASGGGLGWPFFIFVVATGAVVLLLLRLLVPGAGWLPAGGTAAWLAWKRNAAEPGAGEEPEDATEEHEDAAEAGTEAVRDAGEQTR